ncbi:MAG: energy transducer TonB [Sphingomonadales bacterium]|nr:energy transducer TonB [Sphingomonadales bacterium]MBK6719565.1 energy transducer TonB [Sphingomonadales bacterium]MBK8859616.1 energy transducer TonB [Sphingomonadales bacterium]
MAFVNSASSSGERGLMSPYLKLASIELTENQKSISQKSTTSDLNTYSSQTSLEILNPSDIISSYDYPIESIIDGQEGFVLAKITSDSSGKILNCQITASSGFPLLDKQTCTSISARAHVRPIFPPNEPNNQFSVTRRVRWSLPVTAPRPLFLGVTLVGSTAGSEGKVRCRFTDGVTLFVSPGTSCIMQLPTQEVEKGGRSLQLNIVDYYKKLYEFDKRPEYAFNIAMILIANSYTQGFDYLLKASDGGIGQASYLMCSIYTDTKSVSFDLYQPRAAPKRCIMAHEQGIDDGITFIDHYVAANPAIATDEEKRSIAARKQLLRAYTADAVMLVRGDQIVRPDDYPMRENKRQIQGRTVVTFRVGDTGRVDDCLVVESSLSYALDQTVCRRFREAASFTPAVVHGRPSPVWHRQAVNWRAGVRQNPVGGIFGAVLGVLLGAL